MGDSLKLVVDVSAGITLVLEEACLFLGELTDQYLAEVLLVLAVTDCFEGCSADHGDVDVGVVGLDGQESLLARLRMPDCWPFHF